MKKRNPWKEAQWLDLWSFVHFTAGAVAGVWLQILSLPLPIAIGIGLIIALGWEYFEKTLGVKESRENITLDVIVAGIAGLLTYIGMPHFPKEYWIPIALALSCLLVILEVSGWRHYRG